ncbi:MAG: PKD domain-containing protein, partial [Pedobacter sp.]
ANYCGTATINPAATINACTSSAGLTYAWSFPGGTPSSSSLPSPGAVNYTTSGNYTVSLIVSNECGASAVFQKPFLINDIPILTTTPLTQTICSGTATTLVNLTSDLPGTTFTWTATATPGITGFIVSGSTNLIPIQTIRTTNSSSGTINYVITPSLNGCIGAPSNYVINVNPAPSITTQPASSTVCQGGTPTILAVALSSTSGNPTYQWYSNTSNNTTTGTIISGETNPTFSPLSNTIGTTYYYCVISLTSGGCSSIKSDVATVIIANSARIVNQPQATQNLCVGSTIASPLTVTHSGGTGSSTYQWYSNSVNSTSGGTIITGAVNATFTPPVFTASGSNYYYVIITLSGNSCGNLTSAVAEIIVNNDPIIATQPLASQTVCQTAVPTNLEVIMADPTGIFSYQWYSNSVNNTTSGTIISGATSNIYTPPTPIAGTKYYYCIITQNGIAGCGITSATATVITNIAPNFTTQPVSNTLCLGQTTPLLNVAYANGSGTAQYQW